MITYNPMKYIRGAKLLDGNISYNEIVIEKGKGIDFTYEDYKNSLKEKKPPQNIAPTVKPNNLNDTFSYETYKQQKGPIITREENKNSNTDYIVDKMLHPNNAFLNFNVDKGISNMNINNTMNQPNNNPPQDEVYNPYSSLKLTEFKPVYKSNIPEFNNFNNNFSNNNVNTPTGSVHNLSIPGYNDNNKDKYKYNDSKFPTN
jgi:hypothetical protein